MSDTNRLTTTRRRTLLAASSGVIASLAGCAALTNDGTEEELSFDQLQRTTVYVDEAVELAMPADVPTASTTENADLLVLPGDPAIVAQQAVNWLAEERILALVGSASEATWLDWAQSDPFTETFGPGGYADGEPDPLLLVAAKIGETVPTYRHSWGDTPRDRDLLRALDEDLADIANRTPT